jgi:sugar lactone lactonase YvrE
MTQETSDLGESPLWHQAEGVFYWVDINASKVFRLEPSSGAVEVVHSGEMVTALGEVAGGLLMVSSERISIFRDGNVEPLAPLSLSDSVRTNDGKLDPEGRLWFGTMDLAERRPIAELFRLDGDEAVVVQDGVIISNGQGWSPGGEFFYHIDSVRRLLYRYEYDLGTGLARNREVLVDMTDNSGFPDGMAVDVDGNLWVAMYSGARIDVFDPGGNRVHVEPLEVRRPTSLAFGGDSLSDLYVTTAINGLDPALVEAQPLTGHVLRFSPGTTGLPQSVFPAL